jgi:LPXTG-motif cell wall-anchored protein
MRQKGLVQVMVATACAVATCMPCGVAFADRQTGTGVTDVTVTQVVPKDDSEKDEPSKTNPDKETPDKTNLEKNETDKNPDSPIENDGNEETTPAALKAARKAAEGNTWAVVPVSGGSSGGAVSGASPSRVSVLPLAKTGDDNLVGVAAIVGGAGAGLGAMALMMRKRNDEDDNEAKGDDNEEN